MDLNELLEEFQIGTQTYPNELRAHLQINRSNLSEEFAGHSELFAWYATAYELAQEYEGHLKVALERVYAQLDYMARTDLKAAGIKYTEKMVENTVITQDEYRELQDQYLLAKRNTGVLKAARDAMIQRKDMLVSLGANYRAEGASDISLKSEYVKHSKF